MYEPQRQDGFVAAPHLQESPADFNRPLSAYLTNQVAISNAASEKILHTSAQDGGANPQLGNAEPFFLDSSSAGGIQEYTHSSEKDPPANLDPFQQPFVPQDVWQMPMLMPMTPEWDWAEITGGQYPPLENGITGKEKDPFLSMLEKGAENEHATEMMSVEQMIHLSSMNLFDSIFRSKLFACCHCQTERLIIHRSIPDE